MHQTQNTIARTLSTGPKYSLAKQWKGVDIVPAWNNSDWKFFLDKDPTNSTVVRYSQDGDLIVPNHNDGSIKIYASRPYTDYGGDLKVDAIRLYTTMQFDHGLFVMYLKHIPERPGTWPAWWLNGTTDNQTAWACRGEIDIIEGMNYSENHPKFDKEYRNVTTLHTNTPFTGIECRQNGAIGVSQPTCNASSYRYKTCGCSGKEPCPDLGCSIKGPPNSFGKGFNKDWGDFGGVYICELTPEGQVSIWLMSPYNAKEYLGYGRDIIPSTWTTPPPYARFNRCPGQFANMQMIINTTVCGDWWSDKSCLNLIASQEHDTSENLAYWEIQAISVYQQY